MRTLALLLAASCAHCAPGRIIGGKQSQAVDSGTAQAVDSGTAQAVDSGTAADVGTGGHDAACMARCDGKQCGDDGCGGSCGECVNGAECTAAGLCVAPCIPRCDGAECGDDGCGGSCGACNDTLACVEGHCSTFAQPAGFNGLHGYIHYSTPAPPDGYDMGMGFYSAVWSLVTEPLANFQIGLPGVWILPKNNDATSPLCPEGTLARSWPERGPTWDSVFQTIEGGLGYWAGNRFRYGPPKFSMNGTSQCYDYEIASPGWSFFGSSAPLADDKLGIAQLSNRLLIPPDGLPFDGKPAGEQLGYAWMALPFTPPVTGAQATGDESWTCFLSAANFKGPIAYYVPQTWSRIARVLGASYDVGRGLDARPGVMGGGAMEINTVPYFRGMDAQGTTYTKIPQLHFPTNENGDAVLVRDVTYYAKGALYDAVLAWRTGGPAPSGRFSESASWKAVLSTGAPGYDQGGTPITGIDTLARTTVYDSYAWGLHWEGTNPEKRGLFPRYFKRVASALVPVSASEVPVETGLRDKEFPRANAGQPYAANLVGAWGTPGPASDEQSVQLRDGTRVVYRWYRFIDQPVFAQFALSAAQKAALQSMIEKLHAAWTIDRDYMPPPAAGSLVRLDPALIVTPPKELAVGYVPIIVRQEAATK